MNTTKYFYFRYSYATGEVFAVDRDDLTGYVWRLEGFSAVKESLSFLGLKGGKRQTRRAKLYELEALRQAMQIELLVNVKPYASQPDKPIIQLLSLEPVTASLKPYVKPSKETMRLRQQRYRARLKAKSKPKAKPKPKPQHSEEE